MPSSFIRSTIDTRQLSVSPALSARPSSILATSTLEIAAAAEAAAPAAAEPAWATASAADGAAPDDEKPQHRVTIGKPFYLGKYEVTQAQWRAVMGSSPYLETRSNDFYHLPGMAGRLNGPNNPATVSWNDAQEFIKRLNVEEGHGRYRLPTEAEWEYAARAGTGTAYSFGDDARDLGRFAWYGEDFASGSTHPVGQKAANPWGLYDMHGNVWEWVQDWYGERHYANSPALDPGGPQTGSKRVVRGGSWHQSATSWRSAFR